MTIIVDAYNVLKGALGGGHIDHAQRNKFLQQLGLYARKKGHALTAVFDGGEFVYPFCEDVHGVTVCYAGKKLCADNFIRKMIQQELHKDQLLVITSDRAVAHCARQHMVNIMGAQDFYGLVLDTLQAGVPVNKAHSSAVKTTESHNEELDALMAEAAAKVHVKADDVDKPRERSAERRSKHERKMVRLIKKL